MSLTITLPLAAALLATPFLTVPQPGYGQSDLQRQVNALRDIGIVGIQARASAEGEDVVATAGRADAERPSRVSPDSHFRIASTTKTFVATVVLQLVAENELSLDDPVVKWLPQQVEGPMTVRQILQHTARVPNYYPDYATYADFREHRYDPYTHEELVDKAMRLTPPTEKWSYSNTGYYLAGMLIKKITGSPWHEEVERRISRPLGLDRTLWSGHAVHVPRPHAKAYKEFAKEGLRDVTSHYDGDAAGGLISTTRDVNRFYRALLGGEVLAPAQLAEMKRTVRLSAPFEQVWPDARYGIGIFSRTLPCGGRYWSHGGDDYGYSTKTAVTADGKRSLTVSLSSQPLAESASANVSKVVDAMVEDALCNRKK
ncbi:serine hydrolase domain-containing protein [Streptomyces sp. NPDC048057]|uniref:serine hydrolase domain-containing protein n=1 Tax=Streptomyces sp. NPDC048057 TaxID=3155628 RepID=UPI0033C2B90D